MTVPRQLVPVIAVIAVVLGVIIGIRLWTLLGG
jgi:hypothetical protein